MTSAQLSTLTGTFTGAQNLTLYYQAWYPSTPTRAVVAVIHGFGEHSNRYKPVARTFNRSGYALFSFDNQGHGRSAGQRGHIDHWQNYRDNVQTFLQQVRRHEPQIPVFIWGHSLGALIVLDYVLQQPQAAQGIIVSGPPMLPVGVAKPYLVLFARLFSRFLPRLSLTVGLGADALSRDPQVVAQANADPLMHSVATLRWGTETLQAIATVRAQIRNLKTPILLIHGDADRVNAVDGSQELYARITYPDKTLKIYPGGYHELHNDLDREQVLLDLLDWLDAHVRN
jgi:alpha-beta hydrolase superfamily lysophospholipase